LGVGSATSDDGDILGPSQIQIDVVKPGPNVGDDLQAGSVGESLGIHPRRRAQDDPLRILERGEEVVSILSHAFNYVAGVGQLLRGRWICKWEC